MLQASGDDDDDDDDAAFEPGGWGGEGGDSIRATRGKGNFPRCPSRCERVSDLAEVVAGYRSLQHVVSVHLEDVVAAVRDERSVGQRHALVAEGDDRVSLQVGIFIGITGVGNK